MHGFEHKYHHCFLWSIYSGSSMPKLWSIHSDPVNTLPTLCSTNTGSQSYMAFITRFSRSSSKSLHGLGLPWFTDLIQPYTHLSSHTLLLPVLPDKLCSGLVIGLDSKPLNLAPRPAGPQPYLLNLNPSFKACIPSSFEALWREGTCISPFTWPYYTFETFVAETATNDVFVMFFSIILVLSL